MSALALHPEPGTDPAEVRWVVPDAPLPSPGTAVRVPAELAALLADGTLVEVRVLPGCVVTRAPSAPDWRRIGGVVRHAVAAGVAAPQGWEVVSGTYDDHALAAAAEDLLAGDAGGYVRSHGGSVELVDVQDGVVVVRLRGACQGCPASEVTLRHHLERQLRERCPGLVALVAR